MKNNIENLKKCALRAIQTEVEALKNLTSSVDERFGCALEILAACKGKIVVSGMGKSALVARKAVATFNSTGSMAAFMHAADALHGDLGMVAKDDVLLMLSKSGNTEELKRVLQFVKKKGNKVVSMVSNPNSYLAIHSDSVILVPVEKELSPVDEAPTVSATMFMVLCDAIAMALAENNSFSSKEFGRLHPGGSIGKRLYLSVEDIFDKNNLPRVAPEDKIRTVIMEISSHRLGTTVVLGEEGELRGIITDGDMRRMLESGEDLDLLRAKDIMTPFPKTIDISDLAVNALSIMEHNKITSVVVMREGRYAGIIHIHDIIKEGL